MEWLPSQRESLQAELSAIHARFSHEYWNSASNELLADAKLLAEFLEDDVLLASETKDWVALCTMQGPRYEALLSAFESIEAYIKKNVVFVMHEDERLGPLLLDELDELLEIRTVIESDLAWHHAVSEWMPMSELFHTLIERKVMNTPDKFARFINGMLEEKLVYIRRENEQLGPFFSNNLATLLSDGVVREADLAWHRIVAQWLPLTQLLVVLEQRNMLPWPSHFVRLKRWMQRMISRRQRPDQI